MGRDLSAGRQACGTGHLNREVSLRDWAHALDWAVAALLGGSWGSLLGRLLFEVLPRWFPWGYWPALVLGLCCAALTPVLLSLADREQRTPFLAAQSWPLGLSLGYLVQPTVASLWGGAVLVAGLSGVLWLARARLGPFGRAQRRLRQTSSQRSPFPPREGKILAGSRKRTGWAWDLLVLCTALAVYVATLAPSVLPGDSGEFQLVAPTLGVPHPTGYPLYVLLGKLFSWLPFGSVAYRVNLLSAVAASIAVWAVYRAGIALELRRAAALLGAALLLVSDTLWSQATIAEKYALHAAFVALTLWLGLRWRAARRAGEGARGRLIAWACSYGLSLTHHRTMLLLAPVYLALLWFTDRDALKPAYLWRPLLAGLLPLLLYGLLPLFSTLDPPYAFLRIDSVRAFLDLVLARPYQSGLFRGGWAALPGRALAFSQLLARQFSPLGLALALAGWVALLRRERLVGWVILGGIVAQIAFALNYYVPNTPVYYLPAYVWLAPCAAVTIDAVLRRLDSLPTCLVRLTPVWPHLALAWLLLVAALPVGLCAARGQGMDQRRAYAARSFDYTYQQLALTAAEPGAFIVSDWLPVTVLWYGRWIEGRAAGVEIVGVDSLEWQWQERAQAALEAGRPTYLSRPIVEAGDTYPVASAGPLVRVLPATYASPVRTEAAVAAVPGGEVELIGYDWRAVRPGPEGELYVPQQGGLDGGSTLEVTLSWGALDVPAGDYAVTLGIVDEDGRVRVQRQSRHPVGGTYPTSRWQPGQVVADSYRVDLPVALPSDHYHLVAVMGMPSVGSDLRREGAGRLLLGEIEVHKPLRWPYAALSVPVRERCGGSLVLLGHDAPPRVTAGETIDIAVQWLVTDEYGVDSVPVMYVVRTDGTAEQAAVWRNNLADWQRGALVVVQYTVDVGEDFDHLEVRGDGWAYCLPTRLVAAPLPVADLGAIHLRDYAYGARTVRPGGTVRLTLEWEAMADITERYKVFVHVLGRNGLPIAQQDNEPVDGTYPTMRWRRGDRISDSYAFTLPEALPSGEYAVEVGLYRISDLTRLPVLDQAQVAIDDKVYLAPIVVE